jgi:hypothetical protein
MLSQNLTHFTLESDVSQAANIRYKQVQIPRNVKLFLRVVTLIAQTQGYQQNT